MRSLPKETKCDCCWQPEHVGERNICLYINSEIYETVEYYTFKYASVKFLSEHVPFRHMLRQQHNLLRLDSAVIPEVRVLFQSAIIQLVLPSSLL